MDPIESVTAVDTDECIVNFRIRLFHPVAVLVVIDVSTLDQCDECGTFRRKRIEIDRTPV